MSGRRFWKDFILVPSTLSASWEQETVLQILRSTFCLSGAEKQWGKKTYHEVKPLLPGIKAIFSH